MAQCQAGHDGIETLEEPARCLAGRAPTAIVERYFCSMVRYLTPLLLALAVLLGPVVVPRAESAPAQLVYLALGDSVPSGTDLADGDGYPGRLEQQLADASGRPIRLINRAQPGERSTGVLANQ